jgi:hypothetical protein
MSRADNTDSTTPPGTSAGSATSTSRRAASQALRKLTRRSVTTGALAAVMSAAGLSFGTAFGLHKPNHEELVRALALKLLNDRARLTSGEWIERKRTACVLLALIGDEFEPWEQWELELMADIERRRGAYS